MLGRSHGKTLKAASSQRKIMGPTVQQPTKNWTWQRTTWVREETRIAWIEQWRWQTPCLWLSKDFLKQKVHVSQIWIHGPLKLWDNGCSKLLCLGGNLLSDSSWLIYKGTWIYLLITIDLVNLKFINFKIRVRSLGKNKVSQKHKEMWWAMEYLCLGTWEAWEVSSGLSILPKGPLCLYLDSVLGLDST